MQPFAVQHLELPRHEAHQQEVPTRVPRHCHVIERENYVTARERERQGRTSATERRRDDLRHRERKERTNYVIEREKRMNYVTQREKGRDELGSAREKRPDG